MSYGILIWVIEIVYDMNGTETINVSALFPSCFDHLHLAKTLNKLKYNPDLEEEKKSIFNGRCPFPDLVLCHWLASALTHHVRR